MLLQKPLFESRLGDEFGFLKKAAKALTFHEKSCGFLPEMLHFGQRGGTNFLCESAEGAKLKSFVADEG